MDHTDDLNSPNLAARVEKLEKENRLLKRLTVIGVLSACVILVMGQAPAVRTIVADEFVLKDSAGITRATLGFHRDEPTLMLFDSTGRERASLMPEAVSFRNSSDSRTAVLLGSNTAVSLDVAGGQTRVLDQGPGLLLFGAQKESISLRAMSAEASLSLSKKVVLMSGPDGPSLTLSDEEGFRSMLGSASLVTPATGEKRKTSAASLLLFDKGGNTIWSAP